MKNETFVEYLGTDGKWHILSTLNAKSEQDVINRFAKELGMVLKRDVIKFRLIRISPEKA